MALSIMLPQNGKGGTTKDYIVTVLGYDWPLTTKQIFNLLKKKYRYAATYQAVFKTLKQLVEEGIIEKKDNGYQLNLKWLKELHRYTEIVETNYYTKDRLKLIEGIKDARTEGNINILTFETLFDVEKYLYYLQKQFIQTTTKKQTICMHHNHEWRPIFYLRAEYNWQKKLHEAGHQTLMLCRGNTKHDKRAAQFYKGLGCKIKTNAKCASMSEMMVFDDFVIQVFLPTDIRDAMDRLLSKEILNHKALFDNIFEKQTDIQVVLNRDRKIAEQIRQDTLRSF